MKKTLLVIGGSSDIGIGIIKNIYENYDMIIASYNHMNEKLDKLRLEIGNKLFCIQADLSDESQVKNLIQKIQEQEIVLSHIIHLPAPQCKNSKFNKIEWKVFQNEIDICLKSIILILQTFLPQMVKNKYGRIILMLSYVVNNLAPGYCSNYVVTKYALLGLMKSLATEYANKGITVNGISPSWVMTKYISNQPDLLIEKNAQESPIGRNLEVEDIVPAVDYLFSDGAVCVNGENISITCGK